jgi:hypothetical protein
MSYEFSNKSAEVHISMCKDMSHIFSVKNIVPASKEDDVQDKKGL